MLKPIRSEKSERSALNNMDKNIGTSQNVFTAASLTLQKPEGNMDLEENIIIGLCRGSTRYCSSRTCLFMEPADNEMELMKNDNRNYETALMMNDKEDEPLLLMEDNRDNETLFRINDNRDIERDIFDTISADLLLDKNEKDDSTSDEAVPLEIHKSLFLLK